MKYFGIAVACSLIFAAAAAADIDVAGMGSVSYEPNQAAITLEFTTEAGTRKEALAKQVADRKGLCGEVEKNGFAPGDIRTSRLSVSPKVVYPKDGPPRIVGYQVSTTLTWTTRDLKKLSTMLDDLENSKYEPRVRVQFSSTAIDKLTDDARTQAVADARRKAALYAKATGSKLGRVKSLAEVGTSTPTQGEFSYTKSAGPKLSTPSEQKVTVQIRVTFATE